VNDAPLFTKEPDHDVSNDAGPQVANDWATTISAGPPDESSQNLMFNISNNTNPGLFVAARVLIPLQAI